MVAWGCIGNELADVVLGVFSFVAVDSVLHLPAEVLDETLHRPGGSITESADSVTFNLEGKLLQHVDLSKVSITLLDTVEQVDHPACTLTARSALSTAFVLVELGKAEDGVDDVGLLVHDDDGSGTETTLHVLECVEVHDNFAADLFGEHWHRGTSWDDSLKVVPTTDHTAAVPFDKLTQRDTHLLLNSDWIVDMTTDTEELSALVFVATESGEP